MQGGWKRTENCPTSDEIIKASGSQTVSVEHQNEIQLKPKSGGLFPTYMCKMLESLVSSKVFLRCILVSRWRLEPKCFF